MYGYQLQTAQELAIRRSFIPNSSQRAKCVKKALRYYVDTNPIVAFVPAKPYADRLQDYLDIMQECLLQAGTLTEKEIKKKHNAAYAALTGKTETIVGANTPGTRTVIFYINFMVERKLMEMAQTQPELFDEYINKKRTVLPIFTSTRHLCRAFAADLPDENDPEYDDAVTTMTASFRTKDGYYARLIKLGYLDSKENRTRAGNTEKGKEGQEVVLNINVGSWVFGWEDAINIKNAELPQPSASFSNDTRVNSSLSSTNIGVIHKQTEAATASPRMNSALCSATDSVEGTTQQVTPPKDVSVPHQSREVAPGARNEKLEKASSESLKHMLSLVFNCENAEKGLIRTNEHTLLKRLLPSSIRICQERLNDIYAAMIHQGFSITETNVKITTIVKKMANDLNNKNIQYIYAPEMWLRMDYDKATLWNYLNPTTKNTESKTAAKVPTDVDNTNVDAWLDWLEDEKGIHRQTIVTYVKKHGKKSVAQAAYFAYLALTSTEHKLKITTTETRYIGGILAGLKPDKIQRQIEDLIKRDKPKPGKIWRKWCENIEKNTTNRRHIEAFYAAKALTLNGNELVIQLKSMQHFEILESAILLLKQAMRETNTAYKIIYELPKSNY